MTRLLVVDLNASRLPQREPYRLLAAQGMQVLLLAPRAWKEPFGSVPFEPEPPRPRYEARALDVLFSGRYHRVIFRGLERAMADFKPDRLWVHAEPENWLAWQALRARDRVAPGAKLSLVSWRNIDYPHGQLPYRLPWLYQSIEDASRAAQAELLCYNDEAVGILGRRGFKVQRTTMGVNQAYFRPGSRSAARKALGLPQSGRILGFAGRFIEAKGVADLIDAAARVGGTSLLLLGNGPAREAWIERAKAQGVPLHMRALGHEQMAQGLQAMDALALPSRSTSDWLEQFGRILVEAMACGIPVVGSSSGAIPQVIGKGGLVFKEGDPADLARQLRRLPALSTKLAKAGRARAKSFEWRSIVPALKHALSAPGTQEPRVALHGLPVFAGDRRQALAAFGGLLESRQGGTLFYLNAHTANLAAADPAYRAQLRRANLLLPDGGGVLLAARLLGRRLPERLALGDLLGPLAQAALRKKAGLYFWGGEAGLAQAAASALGLTLRGANHGFQSGPEQVEAVFRDIRRSRARVVFLGQGSPRQEGLAERLRAAIPGLVVVVCGNAFSFAAGRQSRAPQWMQAASLEWLWRLGQEPGRLWHRYLVGNARFMLRTLWQRLGGRP